MLAPFPMCTWASAPPPPPAFDSQKKVQPSLCDSSCTCHHSTPRCSTVSLNLSSLGGCCPLVHFCAFTDTFSPVIFMTQYPAQKQLFSMKLSMTRPGNEIAPSSGDPRHFPTFISDFPNSFPIICAWGILLARGINCLRALAVLCHHALGIRYHWLQSILLSRFRQIGWAEGVRTQRATTAAEKIPKHSNNISKFLLNHWRIYSSHKSDGFIPILQMPNWGLLREVNWIAQGLTRSWWCGSQNLKPAPAQFNTWALSRCRNAPPVMGDVDLPVCIWLAWRVDLQWIEGLCKRDDYSRVCEVSASNRADGFLFCYVDSSKHLTTQRGLTWTRWVLCLKFQITLTTLTIKSSPFFPWIEFSDTKGILTTWQSWILPWPWFGGNYLWLKAVGGDKRMMSPRIPEQFMDCFSLAALWVKSLLHCPLRAPLNLPVFIQQTLINT